MVSRGTISFALKLANAEAAGAIGLVVYNNEAGSIAMTMMDDDGNLLDGVSGMVPAVSISKTAGENMAAVSEKKLTVAAEEDLVASDDAGQMSYFSSWGVSPDLQLMPDVTGIGGNVYSTADEGEYVVMSGTSMSSPQVAGVSALVLQYIHENYENLSDSAIRVLADALIMCTAEPIISSESSVEVSPRQQGAGLVNAAAAVTSGAYLSVSGNSKPKVELGDDVARTGGYTFTFNIHNLSDEDKTYALDASVLTEDYVEYDGYEFMAGYDRALESDVTFSQDTVTVKANSVVTVSVTVKLTDAGKAWLDEHYVNGGYVEGFVYLNALDEKGVDMSLPFLGFYGDWTEAPVLDSGFWYDEMFWAEEWNEAPTGGYLFQFYGLFTIPDTIPELPYVAVEGLNAEDMLVMEGSTKAINFTIAPLNATNQDIYWSTSDPSVATVDSTGAVTGRNLGTATISGILFDGDNTFTTEFTVTVIASAGMLRGHVLTDMASYGGQFWIEFPDANPSDITYLGDCYYTLFAEEYYNGKIYAYGYDYMDWEGNWQFFTINPDTFEIESMTDMGEGFPYVYDMTYDYSSRIMYATAGYNETDSDLYIVDMVSGTPIPLMATDVSFMGLAADGKGNLYGITRSEETYDPWSWSYTFSDACLYKIDVEAGELELIGSTGKKCNKIASMTIDYDTGNLYWAQLFQQDYFSPVSGGLCYVDLETGAATSLGLIGSAGCQMAGLYSLADNFPEEPELALSKLLLSDSQMVLSIGSTAQIGAYAIPTTVPAELTWTSSDESVVSVDNTGLVTALKQGVATITVTAVYGETTATASCEISVLSEDACFLTYSLNQYGWVKVDRGNINSAEVVTYDDYDAAPVLSMEYVNGTIYGYDTDGNFFSTTDEGDNAFVRTVLGAWDVTPEAGSGEVFEVRDLAYDAKNDRLLALGCLGHPAYGGILGGEKIYEVNLTTGGLTEVCTLEELYNCGGFAVDGNGNGYVYSSYDDGIYTLDLTTGLTVSITTLQTQSLYGDTESVHAMSYDSASGKLYLLFTSNGAVRQLVTMNTADYSLVNLGIFGQVMEDPWGGTSYDFYNGLIIKN